MNANLEVNFAGVTMPNPFILASAPPTANVEMVARAFDMGWGGAVLKDLAWDPRLVQKNVHPRIASVKYNNKTISYANFELGSSKSLELWVKDIKWLRKRYPDRGIIVSLLHSEKIVESHWRKTTRMFDEAGVNGFELNFSCTHGMAEAGGGSTIGESNELISLVTGWVREETDKLVMPKLPAMSVIGEKAEIAKSAGADAIAAINTLNCISGIDINTFIPLLNVDGYSAYQGLSGAAIKPIGLGAVAKIAKATDIPISGMGGIYNWSDAVEYILLGSSTLQVCSAVMTHGYKIIHNLTSGLLKYMKEKKFSTINDFCGLSLPRILDHKVLNRDHKLVSNIDYEKCIGCGRCVTACKDSAFSAIELKEDVKKAVVSKKKCDGCGLCITICPYDCIEMIPRIAY